MRSKPNIIITGTPGVGKTTHCELLATESALEHVSVNQVVKDEGCREDWDSQRDTWTVDEDKLLDVLEPRLQAGGCIVEWHACDLFPEAWIDLVVVLRAGTAQVYDRLAERGYKQSKIEENIDAEVMEVILQEARDSFEPHKIVELQSNEGSDVEANVAAIMAQIASWQSAEPDS